MPSEIQRLRSFIGTPPGSGGLLSQLHSVAQSWTLWVDTTCPARSAASRTLRIFGISGMETSFAPAAWCSGSPDVYGLIAQASNFACSLQPGFCRSLLSRQRNARIHVRGATAGENRKGRLVGESDPAMTVLSGLTP